MRQGWATSSGVVQRKSPQLTPNLELINLVGMCRKSLQSKLFPRSVSYSFWREVNPAAAIVCPGYINVNDTPGNPSPHLTDFDPIQWTLNDAPGFKTFLNNTLGVDLDTLVVGSFEVARNCKLSSPMGPS